VNKHVRSAGFLFALLAWAVMGAAQVQRPGTPVEGPREPRFRPLPPNAALLPLVPNGSFACTVDQGDPQGITGRDLSGSIYSDPGMSNNMCRARCGTQGFRYAGTQFSSYCFCGNSYGRSGASTACTERCSGKQDEICGGAWANSVSTSQANAPPIPSPPQNGMQCVLQATQQDATSKYRHTEIQRWEVAGPAQTLPDGSRRHPVRWTTTGSGEKHVDQVTQQYDVVYFINAAVNQTWRAAKNPAGTEWSIAREGSQAAVHGALVGSQWLTIGGVPQRPTELSGQRWEFQIPANTLKASATPAPVVITSSATYPNISFGYQQASNATSTVQCSWRFMP
jgi:hypothetical protein